MKKFLATGSLILLSVTFLQAQTEDAEMIQKLTQESMVNNSDGLKIELAWAMTDTFWEYIINVNPEIAGTESADEFYDLVSEYNIVAIVIGKHSYGRVNFKTEYELRKDISLKGQDGKNYQPLKEDELSDKLFIILEIFRPIFSQMLGEIGANMQFFVFEKENEKGELIFDPIAEKDVSLKTGETNLTWDLPMSALIPEKKCPKDGELMNGTWNYCPIHGNELEEQE